MVPLPTWQGTMLSALFPREQIAFGNDAKVVMTCEKGLSEATVGHGMLCVGYIILQRGRLLIAFRIIHAIVNSYLKSGKLDYGRHEAGFR